MAKPVKPESFEVTEYGEDADSFDKYSVIMQVMSELERDMPSAGIRASLTGNLLRLHYHCYEMFAVPRLKEIELASNDSLNNAVKHLKKEFKVKTGKVLDIKEDKSKRDYTVQKVSLNERYYLVYWRVFEIG